MNFFSDEDLNEVVKIFLTASDPLLSSHVRLISQGRVNGLLGGVKRRARNRAIINFCSNLDFEDISLTSMKHIMRLLFGVAVNNADLLRWATSGRKANDRVDIEYLLKNISSNIKEDAQVHMEMLETEWKELIRCAKLIAAEQ